MHKIAIVTRNMNSGGAERVISRLIDYFIKYGYEVNLYLMEGWHPVFYKIPNQCNVEIISDTKGFGLLYKLETYSLLRKKIKEFKPDVVLSMPEDIGIYVIYALFGTGIPVVVSERNNPWIMPYKKITRILREIAYPFADGLIFQTKQAASFFSKKQQKKGIVLYNPLDVDNLPLPYKGVREKIIVGAGRLVEQKNFKLLIDAFCEFYKKHTDYKLFIYGEGVMREELEAYTLNKSLPKHTVVLKGNSKKLPLELSTKSVFVLSSDYEGMPNVLIEAMAVGTPVISTDCPSGGSAELIEDGINGFLVPVGDVEKMSKAISMIVDDVGVATKFSSNSVLIKNRLKSDLVCEEWLRYLKKCIIH